MGGIGKGQSLLIGRGATLEHAFDMAAAALSPFTKLVDGFDGPTKVTLFTRVEDLMRFCRSGFLAIGL